MKKFYVLILLITFYISTFAQTPTSTQSIHVEPGWNLMSLPFSVIDGTKNSVFPTATSSAFIFQNGYQGKDTLGNGIGFWVKFDSAETVLILGNFIFDDTIDVGTGWNIIGSLTVPIAMSNIKTDPPDIIVFDFFGYSNGNYQSTVQFGLNHFMS